MALELAHYVFRAITVVVILAGLLLLYIKWVTRNHRYDGQCPADLDHLDGVYTRAADAEDYAHWAVR